MIAAKILLVLLAVLFVMQKEALAGKRVKRIAILDEAYHWPKRENGKVVVPYEISEVYSELKLSSLI